MLFRSSGRIAPACIIQHWNIQTQHENATHRAEDVAEVPDLLEDGSVAATAEVGDRASLRLKRALDL